MMTCTWEDLLEIVRGTSVEARVREARKKSKKRYVPLKLWLDRDFCRPGPYPYHEGMRALEIKR